MSVDVGPLGDSGHAYYGAVTPVARRQKSCGRFCIVVCIVRSTVQHVIVAEHLRDPSSLCILHD